MDQTSSRHVVACQSCDWPAESHLRQVTLSPPECPSSALLLMKTSAGFTSRTTKTGRFRVTQTSFSHSLSLCFTAMIACALFYRFVNFDCLNTFLIIKTLFLDTDSSCCGEMNPRLLISSEREALARGRAIATAGRVTWRSHDRVQR